MIRWRTLPGRLLLVVLTAWAIAVIAPALYRVVTPLASFGLSLDNDGVVADVATPFRDAAQSPAALAGVAPGDRVDLAAAGCRLGSPSTCRDSLILLGGLGGTHLVLPGSLLQITVLPQGRGGGGAARTLQLAARPLSWDAFESIVLLADTLVGIAVVLTAARLVWLRPGPMTWAFFLFASWFNPGQTYTTYALLTPFPALTFAEEAIEAVMQAASYVGLIAFALCFPSDAPDARWRLLRRALWPLAFILFALNLTSFANVFGVATEWVTVASFAAGLAVDALAVLILFRRRRGLSPRDDQRMRWVLAGCLIGLPSFVFAELCQSAGVFQAVWAGGGVPAPALGLLYLFSGALVWFVSEAVRRPRVVSVTIPLRHGGVVTALTLVIAVPIFLAHEWLWAQREALQIPEGIWMLLVGPVVSVLVSWLHDGVVELVDRAFSRSFHRARAGLARISAELARAQAPDEIDRLVAGEAASLLRLSSAAVFRRDGAVFRRRAALGWDAGTVELLDPDTDATIRRCLAEPVPLRLARGDGGPTTWQRADVPVGEARPCLAVAVRDLLGDAMAVLVYGAHVTGTEPNDDERRMLQALAGRAAAAYEHAETERLRREIAALRAALAAQTASGVAA